MKIFIKTEVNCSLEKAALLFDRDLFLKLSPPFTHTKLLRFDGCKKGDEVHIDLHLFGKNKQTWISKITADHQSSKEFYFIDEGIQLPFPLTSWKHIHRLEKLNDLTTLVIDDIYFETGSTALNFAIYPVLYTLFYYRVPIYKRELK